MSVKHIKQLLGWAASVTILAACAPSFQLKNYPNTEDLYRASLREFERGKWDFAITGFEKLTLDLPARDTLLPRSYHYLAMARERKGEHLLAAQTFTRLAETFPDDTLADDALFNAGRSYQALWRKPSLDATYGESAQGVYRTLLSVYPNSSLAARASAELARLDDWFARKDYETAMHYLRRKAYDSAILYFKDVIQEHPDAPHTRLAYLRLLEAYRQINYREEATELCQTMREAYATDSEVREACGAASTPAVAPATP
jgi:outer membrane assembly lipoprotein YfiO